MSQDLIFLHCADLHLGRTYAGAPQAEERYEDYFCAGSIIVRRAVEAAADALVIAGDLFHEAQILPRTLARAVEVLQPLKQAGIPVIAVEGNHDWIYRQENVSWLEALSQMGYLCLLRPERRPDGRYDFPPWDAARRRGGRLEVKGVHFYGVGYIGALAGGHVPRIVEAVRAAGTGENVLLFHVGIQGHCWTDLGNMSLAEAQPLAEAFQYVALGHGHRAYEIKTEDGIPFAFNPGSPERVNFGEEKHSFKGFHQVTWPTAGRPRVERIATSPRPMVHAAITLDGCKKISDAEERLRVHLRAIDLTADGRRPVIKVRLTGRVGFRPFDMSQPKVLDRVGEFFDPLHVEYENALVFSPSAAGTKAGPAEALEWRSLDEMERGVVEALLAAQSRYQPAAARWAALAIKVKEVLLDERVPAADLLDMIHRQRQEIEGKKVEG